MDSRLMKALYLILAMLITGCSIGTISLQDNRSIEVKPHYIKIDGDIEPWDWVQVHRLYDKITKE